MAAPTPNGPIVDVLQDGYKRPFMLLIAIGAAVAFVVGGITKAESFVDGRIELKLGEQRKQSEEQARRLEKIEEQFLLVKETLGEIRVDVRVLRARVEGNWEGPKILKP